MGRMDGKVAFITGGARGQGRSHALRLAEEGCDIIAVDACSDVGTVPYAQATLDDLAETAKLVENLDRRIVTVQADVRDGDALKAAVEQGVSELGHIDVVLCNAGIASIGLSWELDRQTWQDMIDINLTGVWETTKAVIPTMINQGTGGSIIITSSIFGLSGAAGVGHYVAAKHGVVGLMRTLVNELSPHRIRVNCVNPTTVNTDMVNNTAFQQFLGVSTQEEANAAFGSMHALPVEIVQPVDISNAVLFLASDEARYVTGLTLTVDAGFMTKVG